MPDVVASSSSLPGAVYPPAISLREVWPWALFALALLTLLYFGRRRAGRGITDVGQLGARVDARRAASARFPLPLVRPAVLRNLLLCGLVAGLCAGLVSTGFASLAGEPSIDRAIAYEDAHAPAADPGPRRPRAGLARAAEERRAADRAGRLRRRAGRDLGAGLRVRLRPRRAREPARDGILAGGGGVRRAVPRAVPQVPGEAARGGRSGDDRPAHGALLDDVRDLGVHGDRGGAAAARPARAPRRPRRDGPGAAGLRRGCHCRGAGLPGVHEVPSDFPATTLWQFREVSVGMQAAMWTMIGLLFGFAAPAGDDRATGAARGGGASGSRRRGTDGEPLRTRPAQRDRSLPRRDRPARRRRRRAGAHPRAGRAADARRSSRALAQRGRARQRARRPDLARERPSARAARRVGRRAGGAARGRGSAALAGARPGAQPDREPGRRAPPTRGGRDRRRRRRVRRLLCAERRARRAARAVPVRGRRWQRARARAPRRRGAARPAGGVRAWRSPAG